MCRPAGTGHTDHLQRGHEEPAPHPRQIPLPLQPERFQQGHQWCPSVHPRDHGGTGLHEETLGS